MKITAILTALLATASGGAYAQSVDSTYVSSIVTALKSVCVSEFAHKVADLTLSSIGSLIEQLI
jgi:hypothetical protein